MGRHPEYPGDLVQLELPRLQELRLIRRYPDGLVFKPLLQYRDLVGIDAPPEQLVPALPHLIRVLQYPRMLQYPAGRGIIGKELRPVFLRGDPQPHRVLRHGDGRVPHDPVIPKAGDMQHLIRRQVHLPVLPRLRRIVRATGIKIVEIPPAVPVNRHLGGHQWVQPHHLAPAVSYNLRIGVPIQQQVPHQRLPEIKGRHLRVRLIMQQPVQRMLQSPLFTPVLPIPVHMERKPRHRLRQHPDAGIHRRHLHGRPLVHRLAAGGAAEEEPEPAPAHHVIRPVHIPRNLRLIPHPEQPPQNTHNSKSPLSS